MSAQPDTKAPPKQDHPVWERPECGLVPDDEVDYMFVHLPCGNFAGIVGKTETEVTFCGDRRNERAIDITVPV